MDIAEVLSALRPDDDWGPCAQSDSTYADLARTWRGSSPVPSEKEMLAAWAELEATRAERAMSETRTAALMGLLTRSDETGVQVRMLADAICTLTNDVFEEMGKGRPLVAANLLGYIAANPTAGDPVEEP